MITRKEIDLGCTANNATNRNANGSRSLSIDRRCRLSGINGSTTKQLPSAHPQNGIPLCLR